MATAVQRFLRPRVIRFLRCRREGSWGGQYCLRHGRQGRRTVSSVRRDIP
ncbi:hypothetical protein ABZ848_46215 [Streptomyces sp. NPDC047081]